MYLPGTTKEDSSPLRAASVSFVPPPTVGMAEITWNDVRMTQRKKIFTHFADLEGWNHIINLSVYMYFVKVGANKNLVPWNKVL